MWTTENISNDDLNILFCALWLTLKLLQLFFASLSQCWKMGKKDSRESKFGTVNYATGVMHFQGMGLALGLLCFGCAMFAHPGHSKQAYGCPSLM